MQGPLVRGVFLDFETYYDEEYTLKKLPIEAYVRDGRFKVHMLGVAVDREPVNVITDRTDITKYLLSLRLTDSNVITFIQNAKFDGFILREHYGIVPAHVMCLRAMARFTGVSRVTRESLAAQNEFLGTEAKGDFVHKTMGLQSIDDLSPEVRQEFIEYCRADVEQLRTNVYKLLPLMGSSEVLEFISMSEKMYIDPVLTLDEGLLLTYKASLIQKQLDDMARLQQLFHFTDREDFLKAVRSKSRFCSMLEAVGGVVPYKLSDKKTATLKAVLEAAALQGDSSATARLAAGDYKVMEPALAKKDLGFMELLDSDNEDVALLAQVRANNNTSIEQSRTETFLGIARRGTLPVSLEPYQAWTGRYTGGGGEGVRSDKMNMQNLSKRGGDTTLRRAVQAPEGFVLVAADSSQIEARVLAWLAGEHSLLVDFRSGACPYCRFAASAYGVPYDEIYYWTKGEGAGLEDDTGRKKQAKMQRFVGKTGILQLGYGSGGDKLATYLSQQRVVLHATAPDGATLSSPEIHKAEAQRIVHAYRVTYPAIPAFWWLCEAVVKTMICGGRGTFGGPGGTTFRYEGDYQLFGRRMPRIILPDGYSIFYPGLRFDVDKDGKECIMYDRFEAGHKYADKLYGGKICNNVTQALAFAIMRWQALRINREFRIVLNVHDEWVTCVYKEIASKAAGFMEKVMSTCPPWVPDIPLACESFISNNYMGE